MAYATALAASWPEQARPDALTALELDQGDPVGLARLAALLLNLGERDAARSCAEHGGKLPSPENVAVAKVLASQLSNVRGAVAALDGDNALAEEALRAAHAADPSQEFFARDLAESLGSRRRFAEALRAIDETPAIPARPGAHNEQGAGPLEGLMPVRG